MATRWQTGDGAIHDSEEAARDHNTLINQLTNIKQQEKVGGALVMLICVVGPFIYIPQLLVKALMDYGIMTSFGTMFLLASVPLMGLVIWALIRSIRGKKLLFIILAVILVPCGFLGFFRLLTGMDYLYNAYVSIQSSKFADGKNIYVTAPSAVLYADAPANTHVISNLKKGASFMLIGAGDSGQLLVRYRKDGDKLVWGWIDADKTSYKNSSFKGLVPATILSDTLNLRMYQKPGSRKFTTIDNASNGAFINAAVIGKSSNPFVGTKGKKGYVPIYAWNPETSYRYVGYAPIDSLFLHNGSGAATPSAPIAPEGTRATLTANTFMYDKPHWEPGNDPEFAVKINDFSAKELKKGDTVILVGNADKDNWRRIWFDGEYGWLNETINYRADDWLTRPLENLLVIEE